MLMLPEIIVVATAFLILAVDLFLEEKQRKVLPPLAVLGIVVALGLTLNLPPSGSLFGGRFEVDRVAMWFKVLFLISTLITLLISTDALNRNTRYRKDPLFFRGEFLAILMWTTAGMMLLISARELIGLYVALELATMPLFVLVSWRRDADTSSEAGMKYLLLAALSSGCLLYGLSLIYGLTGETHLQAIAALIHPSPAFWLAVGLITTGIGFKLTIVPFHMWAADVYQGAPVPVTAFLSVASKCAGLAFMFQIVFRMLHPVLADLGGDFDMLLAVLATVTMTLGNCVAIVQHNIKRFMAFSAISQAGYVLMGFLGGAPDGVPAMLFYMLVYVLTNLTVFGVIVHYTNETGREQIEDYRGLSRTNPLLALAMMIGLFSLAGIPPLAGFVGKFFLFSIASKAGFHWLVAVAAVNSTISLYYYLRVVRQMYIEDPFENAKPLGITRVMGITVGITALCSATFGVIPFFYETIHAHTAQWLTLLAG